MLYLSDLYIAPAPRIIDIVDDHTDIFISRATARVFTKLYGFKKLLTRSDKSCIQYYSEAIEGCPELEAEICDALVHNHTGSMCGVFGERVMLRATRQNRMQYRLGFSVSASKCATPMQLFTLFERSRILNEVLLITGDIADNEGLRVTPVALCSDIICTVKVSKKPTSVCIKAVSTFYDGQFSQGIWLDSSDEVAVLYDRCYRDNVEATVLSVLEKAGMIIDDVDHVLPHNVNIHTWQKLAKQLGISMKRVYSANISQCGHCFGGDMFVNLHSLREQLGTIHTPVRCLAVSAGIGASFGATIIELKPELSDHRQGVSRASSAGK